MRLTRFAGFMVGISCLIGIQISGFDETKENKVPDGILKGFDSITAVDSYSYLEFLSADELEGRKTASRGLALARKYIKSLYKTWGIEPAGDIDGNERRYEQRIDMTEVRFGEKTRLLVHSGCRDLEFVYGKDFKGGEGAFRSGTYRSSLVFAGYGLSAPDLGYDDFAGLDFRGKIVVILDGKPGEGRPGSPFNDPVNRSRFEGSHYRAVECARELARRGALLLLIVDERLGRAQNSGNYIQGSKIRFERPQLAVTGLYEVVPQVPFFQVSRDVADCLLFETGMSCWEIKRSIDEKIKPCSAHLLETNVVMYLDLNGKPAVSSNLIGVIEGSDPLLKHEYVLIGAHLDHMGMTPQGYVLNGADDNASGATAVLQAAKAFSINSSRPKRSILFAHWTGEEMGIVGSSYFSARPTVPMDKIIACINLDMIGRNTSLAALEADAREFGFLETDLSGYPDAPEKILMVFTASRAPWIGNECSRLGNRFCGLEVALFASHPMLANSDHFPFAQKSIPSLLMNTARHQDLHQPGDTIEKINVDKMSRVARLVYLLAFLIADKPDFNSPGAGLN